MNGIACPLCGVAVTVEALRRERVPVHQNLVYRSRTEAVAASRGTLVLELCGACGFAFNSAFQPELMCYDEGYENSQMCSAEFGRHVDRVVETVARHGGRVLEVGCGNGAFLRQVVAPRATGVGYDPAYSGPEEEEGGRLRFYRRAFGAKEEAAADVVVCRHVIEHVPRPDPLLRAMGAALRGSPAPRLFIETPSFEWILDNGALWDLFYEHCSLFTADCLREALGAAGFRVLDVQRVFGDQYLWAEAEPGRPEAHSPAVAVVELVRRAQAIAGEEASWLAHCRHELGLLRARGPVAVWGAGAKGATFCNLVDPGGDTVSFVVDINPAKQGTYLGGSGHRIVSPAEAAGAGLEAVLVLNPNYLAEIGRELEQRGVRAPVLDPMAWLC